MLGTIQNIFSDAIKRRRRRIFYKGRTLSRFIAKDVRRDVMIVSADKIDDGFITARIRTTNVLYSLHGLVSSESFGSPEQISVDKLWKWTGHPWGGLPDGTLIVDHLDPEIKASQNDS